MGLDRSVGARPTAIDEPIPTDVACRKLVALASDYLDGVLPAQWRGGLDDHLDDCEGCTRYLEQLRAMIDALEHLDATGDRPLPSA